MPRGALCTACGKLRLCGYASDPLGSPGDPNHCDRIDCGNVQECLMYRFFTFANRPLILMVANPFKALQSCALIMTVTKVSTSAISGKCEMLVTSFTSPLALTVMECSLRHSGKNRSRRNITSDLESSICSRSAGAGEALQNLLPARQQRAVEGISDPQNLHGSRSKI